jgi:hypothetical protein
MAERIDFTHRNLTAQGERHLHAGDDYDWTLTFSWPGSETLIGAKLWLTVKNDVADDDPGLLQLDSGDANQIQIVDADNMIVKFRSDLNGVENHTTDDIAAGIYPYDIQVKFAAAAKIVTLVEGDIEFGANTTKADT